MQIVHVLYLKRFATKNHIRMEWYAGCSTWVTNCHPREIQKNVKEETFWNFWKVMLKIKKWCRWNTHNHLIHLATHRVVASFARTSARTSSRPSARTSSRPSARFSAEISARTSAQTSARISARTSARTSEALRLPLFVQTSVFGF